MLVDLHTATRTQVRPREISGAMTAVASMIEVRGSKRQRKKIRKRKEAALSRPRAAWAGIPDAKPTGGVAPKSAPERIRSQSLSRPRPNRFPPDVQAKIRAGSLSYANAKNPANWQTSSPGRKIKPPTSKELALGQALGPPRLRTGQSKQAVNVSNMYQHMVRAIYNRGISTGYGFKKGASRSSQEIARRKMIQWGYAGRKKKQGGIPDRRGIKLTTKGKNRSSRRHSREGSATLAAKAAEYNNIVARDPL
jgi:hypothetical protein